MNVSTFFRKLFLLSIVCTASLFTVAQTKKTPVDYLSIPGPVIFEGKSYFLSWSTHPAAAYYKQEYLIETENADRFKTMLLIEVLSDGSDIKDIVAAKIAELKKLKENNPIVNYDLIKNPATGEYLVDFLMTANDANGAVSIIEHNVYRYKSLKDRKGKLGVTLFGVSKRAYGSSVDVFLTSLKTSRKLIINAVAQFKMPEVFLSK